MRGRRGVRDRDAARLRHMIDAGRGAVDSVRGRTLDEFLADRILRNSVVRDIEVLGEAASRMSPGFRAVHPEVDWAGIVGMRNRLIHAYFDVDGVRVWKTVQEEIPPLVARIRRWVPKEEEE